MRACVCECVCVLQESNYFTPHGEYRLDSSASSAMLNCLMYKFSYFRFGEVHSVRSHWNKINDLFIYCYSISLKQHFSDIFSDMVSHPGTIERVALKLEGRMSS